MIISRMIGRRSSSKNMCSVRQSPMPCAPNLRARKLGAQGIGLCRTEHMFFEEDRLPIMREMIMARSHAERENALDRLLPLQRADFEGLYCAMDGLPVVIRLLDPPLHEFLPDHKELMRDLSEAKLKLQHLSTL